MHRQNRHEAGNLADFALRPYVLAVGREDLIADRQIKSSVDTNALGGETRIEILLQVLRWDAYTGVPNTNAGNVLFGKCANGERVVVLYSLDGVDDQVEKDLIQLPRFTGDGGAVNRNGAPLLFCF